MLEYYYKIEVLEYYYKIEVREGYYKISVLDCHYKISVLEYYAMSVLENTMQEKPSYTALLPLGDRLNRAFSVASSTLAIRHEQSSEK